MESAQLKRKHVTSACQPCRDSKIKCDGSRPVCGNCSKKNRECTYPLKDDKRRVSLRSAVDILSSRVGVLTRLLTENGIPIPRMDPQEEATLTDIGETLKISIIAPQNHDLPAEAQVIPVHNHVAAVADSTSWPGSVEGYTNSLPEPAIPRQMNINEQENATPEHDGHDSLSMSDGHLTDISTVDWPWHVFDYNSFIIPEIPGGDNIDGAFNTTQRFIDPLPVPRSVAPQNDNLANGSSDEEHDSDLVHQVSARLGALRIASDGQLRYYGAATNYHLLEGFGHDDTVDIFTVKQETSERLEQAGLAQVIPTDLEAHLIDLYFAWHNPSHLTVDRDAFVAGRVNAAQTAIGAAYASDVLINAICAIGAAYETRYHPTFVTYPRSLAEYFASRAKILLEGDLECPTIATVQALCLMSCHEASRGRDARTWLYGGMAMRLCFDLGLHIDCTPYVQAGILNMTDFRARQSTFWSCVVVNHLSSFQLGRPFRVDSEEITVQTPLTSIHDDTLDLSGVPEHRNSQDQELSTAPSQGRSMLVLKEWVFLCETLVPLIRKLYGSSTTPIVTLQEISMTIVRKLERWRKDLRPPLQLEVDVKASPEVLFLHMAYHHFQILIHRPWTSRRSQPWNQQGPGFRHARRMCSDSASAISTLLIQYEKDYSLRRMHNYSVNIIFSAALISLFNVIALQARKTSGNVSNEATGNLSIFFRALDDLSRSFDSAKRAREHLATIQRNWYLSGPSNMSGPKRPLHTAHAARNAKRSRPTEISNPPI